MSAYYNGLEFKTRLEARWAAFFDLAGWSWWINPRAVGDWKPDFKVTFDCGHSDCPPTHTLLVSVLPVSSMGGFEGHPCLSHNYGVEGTDADGGAAFGSSPTVTHWEISHGAGGGLEDLSSRVDNANQLWAQAEKLVS